MTTSDRAHGQRPRSLRALGLAAGLSALALAAAIGTATAQTPSPSPAAPEPPAATQPPAVAPVPGPGPGGGPGFRHGRPNQMRRLSGLFARLDTDKDGAVTKAEYTAFRDQRFVQMDANKDGHISLDEFYNTERPGRGRNPERMKAMQAQRFKTLDKNGDGVISKAEWDAESEAMFVARDKDKSGTLTPDEFGPQMGRRGRG